MHPHALYYGNENASPPKPPYFVSSYDTVFDMPFDDVMHTASLFFGSLVSLLRLSVRLRCYSKRLAMVH